MYFIKRDSVCFSNCWQERLCLYVSTCWNWKQNLGWHPCTTAVWLTFFRDRMWHDVEAIHHNRDDFFLLYLSLTHGIKGMGCVWTVHTFWPCLSFLSQRENEGDRQTDREGGREIETETDRQTDREREEGMERERGVFKVFGLTWQCIWCLITLDRLSLSILEAGGSHDEESCMAVCMASPL